MKTFHKIIGYKTKGDPDLINITPDITGVLESSGFSSGIMTIFVIGSTAGITSFEFEPGLTSDIREFYRRLIPRDKKYAHDDTWGDANGFSHLRSAVTGPSMTVPFHNGKLVLGTWQQVVLAEFDNRPRDRSVAVHIIGE